MFPPKPSRLEQNAGSSMIEVYDKVNKSRLLGFLKVTQEIQGMYYEVCLMDDPRYYVERIRFAVDFMQENRSEKIGPNTRKITTIEQKILTTDVSLEKLMKLDRFYLTGETTIEQEVRLGKHRRVTGDPRVDLF